MKQLIENADVVINVGVRLTDTITAGFTHHLPVEKCIDIQPFEAWVGRQRFSRIPMREAVQALHRLSLSLASRWPLPPIVRPTLPETDGEGLDQHAFWRQIQDFLRPGDIVLADQGTACFGAAALTLPRGCRLIVQALWGSIGYTLPATFGVQTAEPQRRAILLIGDGAAQLTVQELGSMLRDGLKPVIFVLNNQGYTIERAIHGPEQRYNDIARWNWTQLPPALAGERPVKTLRVSDPDGLRRGATRGSGRRSAGLHRSDAAEDGHAGTARYRLARHSGTQRRRLRLGIAQQAIQHPEPRRARRGQFGPDRIHRNQFWPAARPQLGEFAVAVLLHQPVRQHRPTEPLFRHLQQQQIVGCRPDQPPCLAASAPV